MADHMPDQQLMMKRQRVLGNFSEFALRSDNLDEVLTKACQLVGEALGTARAKVLEIQKGGHELLVRAGVGWGADVVGTVRLPMSERSSESFSIREAKPVISQNIKEEQRFDIPAFMKEAGVVAMVNVPILVPGQRPYGLLQVDADELRKFGQEDIDFLRTYVTILGPVIDRLHLVEQRERDQEELKASEKRQAFLLRVSDVLGPLDDPTEIQDAVTNLSGTELNAGWCLYYELDESGTSVQVLRDYVRPGLTSVSDIHKVSKLSIFLEWLRSNNIYNISDIADPLLFPKAVAERFLAIGMRSLLGIPLVREGRLVAVLLAADTHIRRWTEQEIFLLREAVGRAGAAVKRARAEAALRESEEWLRQFSEASQDVLWIRDADTMQWTYLSPAFETIYGLSRAEALSGDNYRNWQDLIVSEDRVHAVTSIQRVAQGEQIVFEYRIKRPLDGGIRWLRDTDFAMRQADGQVRRIGGVGHDVTELKRFEEALQDREGRLRVLIEGVPQLIWRSGYDGLWTWSSPQWLDYTGQTQTESQGWGWLHAVHPEDRAAAEQAWHEARAHGRLEVEYRLCRAADGAWRWHQTRSVPVRAAPGADGPILEWLGTTTDIEDLKRLQGQQQVMVAELQHRTRNLLGVVRNVARRSIDPSAGRDDYDSRLAALGRVQGFLSRSTFCMVPLAELVTAELKAVGNGSSSKVIVAGPPVELPGEGVQIIALALHELATNAVKYGAIAQLSAQLSVTWHVEASGTSSGERLVIEWRESGVTMPPGPPSRQGYGSELITRALPYQLNAETLLKFSDDGVHCRIALPMSAFSVASAEQQ